MGNDIDGAGVPLRRLRRDQAETVSDVRSGALVRLTRGVAVDGAVWAGSPAQARRRIRLEAMLLAVGEQRTVSHRSAGILWGLPDTGPRDDRAHVTDPTLAATHSGRRSVRHAAPLDADDVVVLRGRPVTSLLRTVLDIARSTSFEQAVVVFDHVLHHHLLEDADIRRALWRWDSRRGIARALTALDFADGRSGSPGESVSRIEVDRDAFPPPVLQQRFDTDAGTFYVDFWWPEHGIIGEFDGLEKYRGGALGVVEEKLREDALRRVTVVHGLERWVWSTLRRGELAWLLRRAGLPQTGNPVVPPPTGPRRRDPHRKTQRWP